MTILTPPKRKISLASMALGALFMTSLSAGNANASLLSVAQCELKCNRVTCAAIETLIDCAEKCDYSSIKNCVSKNCSDLIPRDRGRLASTLRAKLSAKEKEHADLMVGGGSPLKPGAALGTGEGAAAMARSSSKEQVKLMEEINILKGAMERCRLPLTSNAPSTPGVDTPPVSQESEPHSPAASHENASSSSKQPAEKARKQAEEAVKKRDNLKQTSSPNTPPSKEATPSSVTPRQRSASPTHVTQQAAAKGSAEDLRLNTLDAHDKFEIHRLTTHEEMKTDQMLKAIKENPGIVNNPEKVVKYLEKLKEEEGATLPAHEEKGAAEEVVHTPLPSDLLSPPDYAPPPLPSTRGEATPSLEKVPPPKRRVVGPAFLTPPPPLRLPPQNNAPQNVQ